ncbi:MAG: DUF4129 domain-containing protein [candidate division WS1 bacterium]|nr:DUF4129 domain-containing protein [candidate division WS1 bacterium]
MVTPPMPSEPPKPTTDHPESVWVPGARSFDPVNDVVVLALLVVMMWCFGSYAFSVRRALYPMGQSLLEFVFLCFLVGVVGISKIRSIHGNDAVSMPYIIGLAFAVFVFVARFTLGIGGITGSGTGMMAFLTNLAVFAVVWAGVNWICRDCTVDPETEETASASMFDLVPEDRRRPGRSVVVFSLLAAMVFGLGQLVLARANRQAYEAGYLSAAAYTGSALLVLALTNLSGLRLYLAGRLLKPPSGMTGSWVALSVLVVALSLGVAWIVPRFGGYAGESIFAEASGAGSGSAASRFGATSGIGQTDAPWTARLDQGPGTAPGQDPGAMGSASDSGMPGRWGAGDAGMDVSGGSDPGAGIGWEYGAEPHPAEQQGEGSGNGSQMDQSHGFAQAPGLPESSLIDLIGKILLVLLGLVALYFLVRFLRGLLAMRRERRPLRWPAIVWPWQHEPPEPNPFANPRVFDGLDGREKVLYCYGAFMAVARRCGCPRDESLTPLEFARNLPGPLQAIDREARELSTLYVTAEYAQPTDMRDYESRIREIWSRLRALYETLDAAPG